MSPIPNNPNQPGGNAPPPQAPYEPPRRDLPTRVILEQSGGRFGRWSSRLGWFLFILCPDLYRRHVRQLLQLHADQSENGGEILLQFTHCDRQSGDHHDRRHHRASRWLCQMANRPSPAGSGRQGGRRARRFARRHDHRQQLLYHLLNELAKEKKIKLVVSMGGMAASGGYYISMAVGDTPDTSMPSRRLGPARSAW